MDSFAKYYLINEFAKTADFGYSSTNFYYKNGKFYVGPAWDFDQSSGNRSITYSDYWTTINLDGSVTFNSFEKLYGYKNNKIYNKLLRFDEFYELVNDYFNKYEYYIRNMYEDNGIIDSMLNKYEKLINNNYSPKEINGTGWTCEYLIDDIEDYGDNIAYLKNWLKNRYEYLKKNGIDRLLNKNLLKNYKTLLILVQK